MVFAAKAIVFRARRLAADLRAPPPRLSTGGADFTQPAGASRSALWSDETLAERALQLGKVQNLRVAARTRDGLFIPAGAVFSFWRNIGLPSAARGYTSGRMLQQGCMVASTGGGLCQLSNALYEVALQAGCRIVERHAHSRIVPGSLAAEATAVRVEALVRAGRRAEARDELARLRAAHPDSPLLENLGTLTKE